MYIPATQCSLDNEPEWFFSHVAPKTILYKKRVAFAFLKGIHSHFLLHPPM